MLLQVIIPIKLRGLLPVDCLVPQLDKIQVPLSFLSSTLVSHLIKIPDNSSLIIFTNPSQTIIDNCFTILN